ncbi:uncharacterized protein CDAR_227581 [Caerostris darwini]|uniref:Uncharacterized protein n=1 Tax=Caerostris darwini TaxID=1538125 RepID=A0AAV4UN20_9ARAC|nr:uncharacterized protein CDAR_227581 [Caerostris darwini]
MNFRQLPSSEVLHLLFTSHRLKKLDLSCFLVKEGEIFSTNDPYAPPDLKKDIDIHVPMDERTDEEYNFYRPVHPEGTDMYLRSKKHMENECNSLLYMLSKDPQPDLQSFVMTEEINVSKFALQPLIQVSTNLTEIHTCLHWFDLNVLMNYKKLRILRLHFPPKKRFVDCPKELLETSEKVLPSLENLEIFTVCNSTADMRALTAIALAHCPKLTSVGHFDSAMAIDFIKAKTDKSPTGCFNLKKCFWGIEAPLHSSLRWDEMFNNLKYSFPELINTAVSSCPFVEELILQVLNEDCLQHLRRLKRLNSLVLYYPFCPDFDIEECFSSLGEIRHQLKHFVIKSIDPSNRDHRFPLNVVIDKCENLETLGVMDCSEMNVPLKMNTSFRRLKSISIEIDLDCLGQILRYCDNLTYLLIVGKFIVDESELRENLSHTSALKLQTLGIHCRRFSKNAIKMVFEKAPNLERVCCMLGRRDVSSFGKELGRTSSVNKSAVLAYDAIRCFAERFPHRFNELNFYSHLQMKQKPSLTLWDIYKIDKSLLISVLGTLVTYGYLVGTLGSVQMLKKINDSNMNESDTSTK